LAAEHAEHGPLDQFLVSPIYELPKVFGIDVSITNSALFMLIAVFVTTVLFVVAMRKRATIPSRSQSLAEITYQFVEGIVEENVGHDGKKYFAFIFTLFLFILSLNLIGTLPYTFAATSHIIVTFGMGAFVFVCITLIALVKKGPIGFFKHFIPEGLPLIMAPLMLVIELVSYLSRPFSLGIRLAANIAAGHTLVKVIAAFVFPLGLFGVLPIAFLMFMTGLEIFVAILQAYVFTLLSCMYLGEALSDHH
jgi:F-type H+-transporting ATPase subunit a